VSTGNLNDGLIAFVGGKMTTMKVPYPTGFYAKGLDGRIDDPNAGWKAWSLDVKRRPRTVASGRRQGHDAYGGAFPAAPRSACRLTPPIDRQDTA
jgi:hypothetical protein